MKSETTSSKTTSTGPQMHYCIDTTGTYDGLFEGENILISAGLAYRNSGPEFNIHVPDNPNHLIIDSGGYQAATRWTGERACRDGRAGRYPYSPRSLHDWADTINADLVAGMDVACEEAAELFRYDAGHIWPGDYRKRLLESVENQTRQRRVFEDSDYDHTFMPVIQGKDPDDYEEFIQLMVTRGLDTYSHIGLGTVCKRSDLDTILDVILRVREYFPDCWLHLFGATLKVYKDRRFDGLFESSDTAAWNWGAESKAEKKKLFDEYQSKVNRYRSQINTQNRLEQNPTPVESLSTEGL